MSLERLLSEVTDHYRDTGFLASALSHLKSTIRLKFDEASGRLVFRGDLVLDRKVPDLLGYFDRCDCPAPPKTTIADADAIFAFSFGYRHRTYGSGGAEARLPGVNNRALAEAAAQLKGTLKLPLFAQFEIADAIDDYTDFAADYSTPREDMNTVQTIKYFLNPPNSQPARTVYESYCRGASASHWALPHRPKGRLRDRSTPIR